MAAQAIGCRAVNILPQQASSGMRVIRKRVDDAAKKIGPESATVTDIVLEMHLK